MVTVTTMLLQASGNDNHKGTGSPGYVDTTFPLRRPSKLASNGYVLSVPMTVSQRLNSGLENRPFSPLLPVPIMLRGGLHTITPVRPDRLRRKLTYSIKMGMILPLLKSGQLLDKNNNYGMLPPRTVNYHAPVGMTIYHPVLICINITRRRLLVPTTILIFSTSASQAKTQSPQMGMLYRN